MPVAFRKIRIELSGIPLNPGIAIGRAYRFKQIDLERGVRNFLCKLVYSAGVFNATNNITA